MQRRENAFKVAENTDAMLAYWDKDLRCKFANSSYIKWFGVSPQDMIDKITLPELLGKLYEKNLPYIRQALKGVMQVFERSIILPNGETRTTIATYKPEIENGQVMGFYAHVADISALKNPFENKLGHESLKEISASEALLNNIEHALRASLFIEFPGIEALARQHFISTTKLKRIFKDRYKSTIFSYYRKLQMQIAEKYLQENIYSKTQIAGILGFENPSNFITCYQKYIAEKTKLNAAQPVPRSSEISTEDHYKFFISQAPLSIAMFDKDFRLLTASKKWFDNYQHENETAIGQSIEELFPETAAKWKDTCLKCLKGEDCRGEGDICMEDGTEMWLRWEMKSWKKSADETGGIIIFTEDITQIKEQVDELKRQVQTFQHTTHFLRIGTWERNFETLKATWNEVTKEILELSPGYTPDLVPALNFYKEGADRERAKKLLDEAFTKGTSFDAQLTLVTAKGKEKLVRVVGFSDLKNGTCKRLYGTFQEVE